MDLAHADQSYFELKSHDPNPPVCNFLYAVTVMLVPRLTYKVFLCFGVQNGTNILCRLQGGQTNKTINVCTWQNRSLMVQHL